jgi:lipopolysaccharide/colanic/teichoic acid biosynthesis glycosyltransferase
VLDTGRPVLFAQQRVGKGGRVFRMYKFRTMVQNAIALNAELALSEDPYGHTPDDPRITRIGRLLDERASTSCRSCSTSSAAR